MITLLSFLTQGYGMQQSSKFDPFRECRTGDIELYCPFCHGFCFSVVGQRFGPATSKPFVKISWSYFCWIIWLGVFVTVSSNNTTDNMCGNSTFFCNFFVIQATFIFIVYVLYVGSTKSCIVGFFSIQICSMYDSIALIVLFGTPAKIIQSVVSFTTVQMPALPTFWTRTRKCFQYESVCQPGFIVFVRYFYNKIPPFNYVRFCIISFDNFCLALFKFYNSGFCPDVSKIRNNQKIGEVWMGKPDFSVFFEFGQPTICSVGKIDHSHLHSMAPHVVKRAGGREHRFSARRPSLWHSIEIDSFVKIGGCV